MRFAKKVPLRLPSMAYEAHQDVWAIINKRLANVQAASIYLFCERFSLLKLTEQEMADMVANNIGRISKK